MERNGEHGPRPKNSHDGPPLDPKLRRDTDAFILKPNGDDQSKKGELYGELRGGGRLDSEGQFTIDEPKLYEQALEVLRSRRAESILKPGTADWEPVRSILDSLMRQLDRDVGEYRWADEIEQHQRLKEDHPALHEEIELWLPALKQMVTALNHRLTPRPTEFTPFAQARITRELPYHFERGLWLAGVTERLRRLSEPHEEPRKVHSDWQELIDSLAPWRAVPPAKYADNLAKFDRHGVHDYPRTFQSLRRYIQIQRLHARAVIQHLELAQIFAGTNYSLVVPRVLRHEVELDAPAEDQPRTRVRIISVRGDDVSGDRELLLDADSIKKLMNDLGVQPLRPGDLASSLAEAQKITQEQGMHCFPVQSAAGALTIYRLSAGDDVEHPQVVEPDQRLVLGPYERIYFRVPERGWPFPELPPEELRQQLRRQEEAYRAVEFLDGHERYPQHEDVAAYLQADPDFVKLLKESLKQGLTEVRVTPLKLVKLPSTLDAKIVEAGGQARYHSWGDLAQLRMLTAYDPATGQLSGGVTEAQLLADPRYAPLLLRVGQSTFLVEVTAPGDEVPKRNDPVVVVGGRTPLHGGLTAPEYRQRMTTDPQYAGVGSLQPQTYFGLMAQAFYERYLKPGKRIEQTGSRVFDSQTYTLFVDCLTSDGLVPFAYWSPGARRVSLLGDGAWRSGDHLAPRPAVRRVLR